MHWHSIAIWCVNCCWDISASLIQLSVVSLTLFCCHTDTHGYSIWCTYIRLVCFPDRISEWYQSTILEYEPADCRSCWSYQSRYVHFVISTESVWISEIYLKDVEDFVSRLVTNKTRYAKIDRPAGVVSFQQTKDPSEVLNEWSHNLNSLMTLVTKTTHLINKERMVHSV